MLVLSLGAAGAAHAQQARQPLDLEVAQALLLGGQAAEAYEMLAPHEARLAGDLTYDYLLARSALESGRPSIASFVYERILAVEPNYVGVRLENGRAYLELQDYARAKQEFETVLRFENLPPDLRTAAEQYARVAQERLTPRRTFLNAYAEYGFGHDDNVNSAIAEAVVPLPGGLLILLDPLSQQREDFYHALNAGGEVVHAVTDNWQVFAAGDYRGRLHLEETLFDYHELEGRAGVGYVTRKDNIRLSGRFGRFFIDDTKLRDLGGVSLGWIRAVDERNQLNLTGSYTQYRFGDRLLEFLDFDGYDLSGGWNHAFWGGRALVGVSLNAGFESDQGGRLDGNRRLGGVGASLQAQITGSVGAYLVANVQRSLYQRNNVLFGVNRNDNYYTASAGVTWGFAEGWSLRPQVSWSRNHSNVRLNDYDRLDMSLNLRKDF